MLTNKGKYGLKALIHLANLPAGDLALVQDIAEANAIPKKFLDTILGELRNAAWCKAARAMVVAIGWHGRQRTSGSGM